MLRHTPVENNLMLDENGWVSIQKLIEALREKDEWKFIDVDDLFTMIECSDKKRHEIVDMKIRALYGHSTIVKIEKELAEPPDYLYHGTARCNVDSIKEEGLLPQKRQYVHLSIDKKTATEVGKRKDNKPKILRIQAKRAFREGVSFYKGNDSIWLSESIESTYIEF